MIEKICGVCNGSRVGDVHTQWDCIDHLKRELRDIRTETVRELDAKYQAICEQKINAAISHMEKALEMANETNKINTDSMRRGRARNVKLEALHEAVSYCYRQGHIDSAAVIYTNLEQLLQDLEDPIRKL